MNNNSLPGRILAIDHGQRRIGLALSDPLRITAHCLTTLKVERQEQVLSELATVIGEYQVTEIVVGMPLNLKGQKSVSAQRVEQFIQQLKTRFDRPVHSWDERWTSVFAQRIMLETGQSPSRHKDKVDQISAQLILQSFLDNLNSKQTLKEMLERA